MKATAQWGGDGACLDLPRRRWRLQLGAGCGARRCVGFYRVSWPPGEQAHTFCLKLPDNHQFSLEKLPWLIKQFPLSSVMFCFHLILSKAEVIQATGANYLAKVRLPQARAHCSSLPPGRRVFQQNLGQAHTRRISPHLPPSATCSSPQCTWGEADLG